MLVAILVAGWLERRASKRVVAQTGNLIALAGFLVILVSGFTRNLAVFYSGVILLGTGTGLSTVANLSLMFDLTVEGSVGLYIGAWGFSNAMSRLTGSLMGGAVRDGVTHATGQALSGYLVVFAIEAGMLSLAAAMLAHIDVSSFKKQAVHPSRAEKIAIATEG